MSLLDLAAALRAGAQECRSNGRETRKTSRHNSRTSSGRKEEQTTAQHDRETAYRMPAALQPAKGEATIDALHAVVCSMSPRTLTTTRARWL